MELLYVCSPRKKKRKNRIFTLPKMELLSFLFVEHERRGSEKLFILPYMELFLKMVGVRKNIV